MVAVNRSFALGTGVPSTGGGRVQRWERSMRRSGKRGDDGQSSKIELGLLLCGIGGLAVATAMACGDSDDADAEQNVDGAGGTSAAGGDTSGASAGSTSTSETSVPGVTATCESDAATAGNTAAVVTAANALLAALTAEQQSAIAY